MKSIIQNLRRLHILAAFGALLAGSAALAQTTNTWNAAGPDGFWTNKANWLCITNGLPNTPATNDTLVFTGTAQLNTTNNYTNTVAQLIFSGITFDVNAGPFVLYGVGITPGAGITDSSAATETFNLPIALGATHSFNVGLAGGNLVINYPISGGQAISQTGLGTLTLNATNTFTGAIQGIAGTLMIGGSGSLNSGNFAGLITNGGVLTYNSSVNQTLSGVISSTGALNQNGPGTLTLSGNNTYSGPTAVNAGELITSTGSSSVGLVNVAAGATNALNVTTTGGQWTCTGLTYSSGTAYTIFNLSQSPSTAAAPLQVNGPLAFTGTPNIIVNGNVAMAAGDYPLIKYTGALSGTVPTTANLTVTTIGVTAPTLLNNTANNSIDLVVAPGGGNQVTWAAGSATWDTSTPNWSDGAASTYQDGEYAVFGDALSGASPITVTLTSTVSPASVIFDDSSKNYTLAGTGSISGTTGLTKLGAGTATLAISNNYTGATAVNEGTLTLDFNALSISSGSTISNNIVDPVSALSLGGGTLNLNGSTTLTNSQTFASVAVAAGSSVVNAAPASGTISNTVNLGGITYATGATVVFNGPAYSTGVTGTGGQTGAFGNADTVTGYFPGTANITTTSGNVNQQLTGASAGVSPGNGTTAYATFATVGLYDFAIVVGASPFTIIGASQGTAQTGTGSGVNGTDGAYTLINAGNIGGGSGATGGPWDVIGSCAGHNTDSLTGIRFNANQASSLASDAAFNLGGVLVTPNVGAFNTVISGASLAGGLRSTGNSGSVVIWQNNTNGFLNISALVSDSRVVGTPFVQAGPGTVNYTGVNIYTGPTYLNGGVSEIYADSGFGAPATGATLNLNGGTVLAGATFTLDNAGANKRPISLGLAGGGLAAVSKVAMTVDGVISGATGTGPLFIGIPASSANGNVLGLVPGTGAGTANTTPTNALGTVLLTGANTYTGGTVIYSGILDFSAGTLGTGPVTLNGGTLQWSSGTTLDISSQGLTIGPAGGTLDLNGQSVTLANPIGGSGAVTVTNGTLTLSAANTWPGGTIVGSGANLIVNNITGSATGSGPVTVQKNATLTGPGSIAGSVSVDRTGSLNPGVNTGVGTLTVGALTLGPGGTFTTPGANFNFNLTASANDEITVSTSGGLTLSGGALSLNQAGTLFSFTVPNTYNLIQYSGTLGGTGLDSSWTTVSADNPHVANPQVGFKYSFASSGGFLTVTIVVDPTAINATWTNDVDGNWSDFTQWNTDPNIPSHPGDAATFGVGSALRTVTLDANESVGVINFTNTHSFVVASAGNALTLDKMGDGAKVNVEAGTANAIQTAVALNDAAEFILGSGQSLAVTGAISNASTPEVLSVTGSGTLALSGANSYGPAAGSFGTVLGVGATLQVGNNSALGAGDVEFVANNTLQAGAAGLNLPNNLDIPSGVTGTLDSQANTLTLSGVVSDSGTVSKVGAGTVTLAAVNTYTGGTTINNGAINVTADNNLGAVTPLTFNGGHLLASGVVTTDPNRNFLIGASSGTVGTNAGLDAASASSLTVPGSIASAGNLALNNLIVNGLPASTGTVFLEGPGSYTGTTTIPNGILQLLGNANGPQPTNNQSLAGSTLVYNAGAGALVFDASMVSASIGQLSGTANLGLSNAAGAVVTLTVGGNNQNATYSGDLTDGGLGAPFIKAGTGTLTLIGSNYYTGLTTVNAGTLAISNGGVLSVSNLAGQGYLVNGGLLTNSPTTVSSLGFTANAFLQTAGTTTIGELTQPNDDGMLVEIMGGTFSSTYLRLLRDNNYGGPTATAPVAALTTIGLYIDSTNTASPAQVYLGQLDIAGAGANSSSSARMDAGNLTVTNAVTIGEQATGGRWSILQINGGHFTNLDTANGVVIGNNIAVANDAELYLSGGSNYVQLINFGTLSDLAAGTGFMFITNSTLYVGTGGINAPNFSLPSVATICLDSGVLGALGDWTSTITANGSGTGWRMPVATNFTIQAADPTGAPHNITLGGGMGGVGSLIQTGGGVLTLSGTNNWTGTTTISNGTLALNNAYNPTYLTSPTITVTSGAGFDVSASSTFILGAQGVQTLQGSGTNNGPLAAGSGAKVYAGLSGATNTATYGTNSFGNGLTLESGAAAYLALGTVHNQSNGLFIVSGGVTFNGNPIHISAPSTAANLDTVADYVLFNVTGGITGNPASTPVWDVKPANSANFNIITNATEVLLHYYASASLPPTGVGSISPTNLYENGTGLVTVTVTPGSNPTISSVVLNETAIQGSPSVTMTPGASHVYTANISIPNNFTPGPQTLTAVITDAAGEQGVATISFPVLPGRYWTGLSATDNNWSDAANWLGNQAPNQSGDTVTFDGLTRPSPSMDLYYDLTGLLFDNTAGIFTIGTTGNNLGLLGGITNNSTNTQTLNLPISLTAPAAINAAAGNLVLEQPIDNGTYLLTFAGPSNTTVSGVISDTGGLTMAGTGATTLQGVNTYSGATTVSSGTLAIGSTGQLGGGNYAGAIADNGTLAYNGASPQTLSGVISGTGALSYAGPPGGGGTLVLSAANSFTGNITITNGTVSDINQQNAAGPAVSGLGNPTTAGRTVTINNLGILSLDGATAPAGNEFGNGTTAPALAFIINQGGQMQITTGNAGIGPVTLNGGTLLCYPTPVGTTVEYESFELGGSVTAAGAFPSVITNTVDVTNAGLNLGINAATGQTTFIVSNTGAAGPDLTVAVPLADAGGIVPGGSVRGLIKAGAGRMALNDQNLYHGATTISNGILTLGSSESPGVSGPLGISAAINQGSIVFGGGILQFSAANQNDYSGRFSTNGNQPFNIDTAGQSVAFARALVSPGGTLTKLGAGTLTLSGANTYSGATTISNGILALGAGGSLAASSSVTILAGATLNVAALPSYTLGATASLTASGNASPATIAGTGAVSLGSRPITLNYDGTHPALTVSSGTLTLNANAFTVNGPLLIPGVYVLIQAASPVTGSGVYTVSGTALPTVSVYRSVISVSGSQVILTVSVSTPPTMTFGLNGSTLKFAWPTNYLGWILQSNSLDIANSGDWFPIAGSAAVTNENINVNTANTNVFYRLVQP